MWGLVLLETQDKSWYSKNGVALEIYSMDMDFHRFSFVLIRSWHLSTNLLWGLGLGFGWATQVQSETCLSIGWGSIVVQFTLKFRAKFFVWDWTNFDTFSHTIVSSLCCCKRSAFDYLFSGQQLFVVEGIVSKIATFIKLCQHYLSCNNLSDIIAPCPNSLHTAEQAHRWHHE